MEYRHEDFEIFFEKMGHDNQCEPAHPETIAKYKEKLPNMLLDFWQDFGWGSVANGLLWIVNPDDYLHFANRWLQGLGLVEQDNFHVFARTAFGCFYVIGEKTNQEFKILCPLHSIVTDYTVNTPLQYEDPKFSLSAFFVMGNKQRYDLRKGESDDYLFEEVLAQHGPLSKNEVYGFKPMLCLGGDTLLENTEKMRLDVHLDLLLEFGGPAKIYGGPFKF